MKILSQRNFLHKIKVEIQEKRVTYTSKKLFSSLEKSYKYEIIHPAFLIKKRTVNLWTLGYSLLLFFILMVGVNEEIKKRTEFGPVVITILTTFLLFLIYLLNHQFRKKIIIPVEDGEPIMIYGSIPNTTDVDDFIETLKSFQKSFLIKKYGKIDSGISVEKLLERIEWLYENDFLTESEYETKKEEILSFHNPPTQLN